MRRVVQVEVPDLGMPYLLTVECPYCKAEVGEACKSAKTPGKPTSSMHVDRFARLAEVEREAVINAARERVRKARAWA